MRSSHAIAIMLMLAAVASCAAQLDVPGILDNLGLDDDDVDGIEDVSGPDIAAYLDAQSPEVTQEFVDAFAPYGIDVYAPEPAIEAQANALTDDQAVGLLDRLLSIFLSPAASPGASPAGRKMKR